jgi:hypothetical protein
LDTLGYAHHHSGEYARAIDCYQRALALIRPLGGRYIPRSTCIDHRGSMNSTSPGRAKNSALCRITSFVVSVRKCFADPSSGRSKGAGTDGRRQYLRSWVTAGTAQRGCHELVPPDAR